MSKQDELSAVKSALRGFDLYFGDEFGVLEEGPANEAYSALEEKLARLEKEIEVKTDNADT